MQRIAATGVFLKASELDTVKQAVFVAIVAADIAAVNPEPFGNLFAGQANIDAFRSTMVAFQIALDAEREKNEA